MKPEPDGHLPFSKLEALGNDFMLVDARHRNFDPDEALVRHWGDRRRGVGFDQLLVLRPSETATHYCRVDIFNSDGSPAEQCGNGMRAVALWLAREENLAGQVRLETRAGTVETDYQAPARISATLTVPDFEPARVGLPGLESFPWRVALDGEILAAHGAALGNPHLLIIEAVLPEAERIETVGRALSRHPALERGANVGLALIESRGRVRLRVYERGAGPTPACGSGAAAAAAILIRLGRVDSPVSISQPGGTLVVNWNDAGQPVSISGPARHVFEGVIAWPTVNH